MKVTVENKKGLNKDLKVFIDKKTMTTHFEEKYNEIKDKVVFKPFFDCTCTFINIWWARRDSNS